MSLKLLQESKPITYSNGVDEVMSKSRSKYGEGDLKMYYMNFDVAV